MQEVGHHLQIHANTLANSLKDVFARSAYNRYYYGCFLLLRSELEQMNSKWRSTNHKDYPVILNRLIKKELTREQERALRRNDHDLVNKIKKAKYALNEMADLMTQAYAVRIVADYKPEVPVDFKNAERFSLFTIDITTAHNWQSRMRTMIKSLRIAWSHINA